MITQIGGEELVNRLRLFMEGCKKTKMSADTQRSRLRVLALALASLSVVSDVFVATLGASEAEIVAARSSSSPPVPSPVGPFLELWLEGVEDLPLLALGLAWAVVRNPEINPRLFELANDFKARVDSALAALPPSTETLLRSGAGGAAGGGGGARGGRG